MMARRELRAARAAIRDLYTFIANELDPDPGPVESYIIRPAAQAAATRAVGDSNVTSSGWVAHPDA